MSRSEKFSRRALLKRLGVGAALLPILEPEWVRAATCSGTSGPRRAFFIVWANGMLSRITSWATAGTGTGFTLPTFMASLEPHRNDLLLLDGLSYNFISDSPNPSGGEVSGHACFQGMLTGAHYQSFGSSTANNIAGGPSIDQFIGNGLRAKGLHRADLAQHDGVLAQHRAPVVEGGGDGGGSRRRPLPRLLAALRRRDAHAEPHAHADAHADSDTHADDDAGRSDVVDAQEHHRLRPRGHHALQRRDRSVRSYPRRGAPRLRARHRDAAVPPDRDGQHAGRRDGRGGSWRRWIERRWWIGWRGHHARPAGVPAIGAADRPRRSRHPQLPHGHQDADRSGGRGDGRRCHPGRGAAARRPGRSRHRLLQPRLHRRGDGRQHGRRQRLSRDRPHATPTRRSFATPGSRRRWPTPSPR